MTDARNAPARLPSPAEAVELFKQNPGLAAVETTAGMIGRDGLLCRDPAHINDGFHAGGRERIGPAEEPSK